MQGLPDKTWNAFFSNDREEQYTWWEGRRSSNVGSSKQLHVVGPSHSPTHPPSRFCRAAGAHTRAPDDPRDQQQAVDVSFPPPGSRGRILVPMDHFIAFVLSEAESRWFCARHRLSALSLYPLLSYMGLFFFFFLSSFSFLSFDYVRSKTALMSREHSLFSRMGQDRTGWDEMGFLETGWTSNEPDHATFPSGRSRVAVWISSNWLIFWADQLSRNLSGLL